MGETDHQLLARVRERDAAAFEALFHRYRDPIRRHVLRLVRDGSAAEDLAQEVFLRVWTRAEQWDGRGSFRAWLYRIATNLCLNHLRAVNRRRERLLELPSDPCGEEESPLPAWLVE